MLVSRYLSYKYGFDVKEEVIEVICYDRGVDPNTDMQYISHVQKMLLCADLLFYRYFSPNITSSRSEAHGNFKVTVGSETLYNKKDLYNYLKYLYGLYDPEKVVQLGDNGTKWIHEDD